MDNEVAETVKTDDVQTITPEKTESSGSVKTDEVKSTPVKEESKPKVDENKTKTIEKSPAQEEVKPSFDWSKWDKKKETLPKPIQDVYDDDFGNYVEELHRQQQLLNNLLITGEDPRISQLTDQMKLTSTDRDTWKTKYTELETHHNASIKEQAQKETETFKRNYPQIWSDSSIGKKFTEILDAKNKDGSGIWSDLEVMAQLSQLPADYLEHALRAKQQGASDQLAFDYAKSVVVIPLPSKSSDMVAGANGGPGALPKIDKPSSAGESLDDITKRIVSQTLKGARK